MELTKETIRGIAHDVFETKPFEDDGYSPKDVAQNQLTGKTHYVDSDTLSFHKSRVLACFATDHGALFSLVESVALDMRNTKRGFRYVVFDLGGQVLTRAALEGSFSTRKAAEKALWEWLDGFDVAAHYHARLQDVKRREMTKLEAIRTLIKTTKGK